MQLCFSTEVVDLNNQAPNRNKRESKYFWDELYTLISAGGFSSIEVPYEAKWDFGGRSGIPRSLRSITAKFGDFEQYRSHLSAHGIDRIDSVHMDPSLFCAGAADMYFGAFTHYAMEAVQFAAQSHAGSLCLTVTPPQYAVKALIQGNEGLDEKMFLQRTAQVIESVAKAAEEAGVVLCLKNEYWGLVRGEEILRFLKKCPSSVMRDADTAHLKIAGVDVNAFVKENAGRIGIVHFTDTDYADQAEDYKGVLPEYPAHRATKVFRDLGDGSLDFQSVVDTLNEIGYEGTVVCNCRNSYDICRSILRTRYTMNSLTSLCVASLE